MKEKNVLGKMYASEVKVDLGLLQDIDKNIESTKKDSQKSFDYVFEAKGMLTQAITAKKGSINNYTSILGDAEKLLKNINDLGLPTAEMNDKINLLKRYIKEGNDDLNTINKALGSL